jgi:hypothetical protein
MRAWIHYVLLGLAIGGVLPIACSATEEDDSPTDGTGGSGAGGPGASTGIGGFGSSAGGAGGLDPDAACAKFTAEAKQSPAAMLIALDRSASMSTSQKWAAAQLAVVGAIDKDVFDTMSLGLVSFPQSFVDPPQCLCNYLCEPLGGCDIATCKALLGQPGVACGINALPVVPLAEAGAEKSNAPTGVRHDIYQYLAQNNPIADSSDASPIYDALAAGYTALQAYPIDKRILVLITDGGFSCTSMSSRPGYSDGACPDWEIPDTVNTLITAKRTDAAAPVNTFIVGVPGSNSNGEMQGSYATAPYSMLLALSTYAVSGSPDTLDPTCDSTLPFTQTGAAPAKSCHIDLSSGQFDANVLAAAIEQIRGKALGCIYQMPEPPPGEVIDPAQVNVSASLEGAAAYTVPRRSDPSDTCLDASGCWDYKDQSNAEVELIGKACSDVSSAKEAKVDILVGCETLLK